MVEPEILKSEQLIDILTTAAQKNTSSIMSFLTKGKWNTTNVKFVNLAISAVHIEMEPQEKIKKLNIQIDQPVGISFEEDFQKYIFETVVLGFEPSVNHAGVGRIVLEIPSRMEKMQRRAYKRVRPPCDLNIKVLFWHLGYNDDCRHIPTENYWQGNLIDLSAGGMQLCIDLEQGPNFRVGQMIGLQFTPAPYEKPVQVEAQVVHVAKTADGSKLSLGIHFLGLEASAEGRQKLHRLVDTVDDYSRQNQDQENHQLQQ